MRVHAASLNLGDWEMLTGRPRYIAAIAQLIGGGTRYEPLGDAAPVGRALIRPRQRILGTDIAGRVEAVGKAVTRYRPGDELFGMCNFGALAEYVCVAERAGLARKAAGMSFEQAAALPQAAFIAVQALDGREQVGPGKHVLVNGAGGGAGSLAVQLARRLGARVTAVDNALKQELLRSLGADHTVDYTREEFRNDERRFDLILDLAAHRSIFASTRTLNDGGIYLLAGGRFGPSLQAALMGPMVSRLGRYRIVYLLVGTPTATLDRMTELHASGEVVPIVDRVYPLEQAAEAFRRVGEGRALGKVVISI